MAASRRLRLLLPALAALLAACAAVTWTGAYFSSTDGAPGHLLTGTLRLSGIDEAAELLAGPPLRPGAAAREGIATVGNDGTLTGVLTVAAGPSGSSPLAQALRLRVDACPDTACGSPDPLYTGTLAGAGTLELGDLAPGSPRTFRVRLDWPLADDDPALYGASADYHLNWSLRDRQGS
jgi:hypothetical protein